MSRLNPDAQRGLISLCYEIPPNCNDGDERIHIHQLYPPLSRQGDGDRSDTRRFKGQSSGRTMKTILSLQSSHLPKQKQAENNVQ
uniref:Uncharacterized protein n=1 Tax=Knipowitschia caucasica TaxID=637954 RepID=A0AAV2MU91_KNICA